MSGATHPFSNPFDTDSGPSATESSQRPGKGVLTFSALNTQIALYCFHLRQLG